MKLFHLIRIEDETGISGTGRVAEGVEFSNGNCVLNWLTKYSSLGVYPSLEEMMNIHGHEGRTVLEFEEGYGHGV